VMATLDDGVGEIGGSVPSEAKDLAQIHSSRSSVQALKGSEESLASSVTRVDESHPVPGLEQRAIPVAIGKMAVAPPKNERAPIMHAEKSASR
jgi:hypothetical protein